MNKAVFLDRDGTINEDYGYVYKIEDWKFKEGVVEGLKVLNDLGFKLIVISNQSGIERGYYTKDDAKKIFEYMKEELKKNSVEITDIYYCPHLNQECDCRKPKLGLFYKAAEEHDIDFKQSYAIGDKERDVSIIEKEDTIGIVIGSGENTKNKIYVNNFMEAVNFIKERDKEEKYYEEK